MAVFCFKPEKWFIFSHVFTNRWAGDGVSSKLKRVKLERTKLATLRVVVGGQHSAVNWLKLSRHLSVAALLSGFGADSLIGSSWDQKNLARGFKELSIDVLMREICVKNDQVMISLVQAPLAGGR